MLISVVGSVAGVLKMDSGFEDLELRESQREYLDFLDDDVNPLIYDVYVCVFLMSHLNVILYFV